MRIARHGDLVTIDAPAKLNLFLELLSRRTDGYHELETLMVAVDLCDTLTLRPADHATIELRARWALPRGADVETLGGTIPLGHENLVVRALEALRQSAGITRGADVTLTKHIPAAAGLGGASSDAAAALVAGNLAWNLHWPREKLAALAAELGSDIPFFLGPPVAICRGRGEVIEPLRESLPPLDVVIVRPPEGLSTPAVYRHCQLPERPQSVVPMVEAWRRGDLAALGRALANRLEPAAAQLSPWIERLRRAFDGQGCYGHQMSGSGSSYFGLCRHARHAAQVAARLRAQGLGHVMSTRTIGLESERRGEQAA